MHTSVSRNAGSDTLPPMQKMRHRGEDDVQSNMTIVLKSFAATIQERKHDDGHSKKQPPPTSSKEVEKEKESFNIYGISWIQIWTQAAAELFCFSKTGARS
jgi:hypothetical protein